MNGADPTPPAGPGTGHPLRRPSRLPVILLVLAALAGAGWLVFSFLRDRPAPPSVAAPGGAPGGVPSPPAVVDPSAVPPAPPETVREALEPVSADPLLRRCLDEGDVVRRWAFAADNVALGNSPRKALGCLAPARPFAVTKRGEKWFISDESYARYDGVAAAIAGLDAAALAAAYRRLHAPLEAAYRLLGYPDGSLDRAMATALARVERFEPPAGEVEVVEGKGAVWELADPELEALGAVEKHLLRMGPHNARAVAERAKGVREALGLEPEGG